MSKEEGNSKERKRVSLTTLHSQGCQHVSDLLLSCRNLTLGSTHFLLLHPFKGMDLAKRRVDIHEGHFESQKFLLKKLK